MDDLDYLSLALNKDCSVRFADYLPNPNFYAKNNSCVRSELDRPLSSGSSALIYKKNIEKDRLLWPRSSAFILLRIVCFGQIVCFGSKDRLLWPKRSSAFMPQDRLLSSGSSAFDWTRLGHHGRSPGRRGTEWKGFLRGCYKENVGLRRCLYTNLIWWNGWIFCFSKSNFNSSDFIWGKVM